MGSSRKNRWIGFFFSSRRRHTRYWRDWSSDVCSSDLDWWAKAEEDFARAHDLGITGLRLSLEWSRIEPQRGEWSVAAFARYREMLACLKSLDRKSVV